MNKIKYLVHLLKKRLNSPVKYARSIGVQVGKNTQIFKVYWSSEPYLISIGDNCQITNGVRIFTHGGANVLRSEYPNFDCFGKVEICDNVYIGMNSLIMPGVIIGNNVLVAAGSVVTKSVPDNVCIGGNPARVLCTIEEYKNKNLPFNTNSKGLGITDKKEFLLKLSNDKFIKKTFLTK